MKESVKAIDPNNVLAYLFKKDKIVSGVVECTRSREGDEIQAVFESLECPIPTHIHLIHKTLPLVAIIELTDPPLPNGCDFVVRIPEPEVIECQIN